ncbi:MAG: polysaccharide pyruvyl transferase family protein [Akkermansiaceae bacterium]|nr:polysaccharide pyruvyl transferase family protein [Akkermansiaceae bacterium]
MQRRHFLATLILSSLPAAAQQEKRAPRIILRNSWQIVNIGDIGHTPGILAILEKHLPEAEVFLWPGDISGGVREMILKRFPKLNILPPNPEERRKITSTCDFFLHGSAAFPGAQGDVTAWKNTGKPYGYYGISIAAEGDYAMGLMSHKGLTAEVKDLLDTAAFVFARDSASLKVARDAGVKSPVLEFGPDGAFAVDLRNDEAATAFLSANGLTEGKFLCCIPNLRSAPYWKVKKGRAFDPAKHKRNEEMKEHDHAPLREAIISVVRETDMKVLVCPEDSTHMEVGKEMLVDPLPDDVKAKVVWRKDFWLTDEAVSTYVRSAGLFGNDMHSPIMCIGNGVPAIYCRLLEKTTKGIMWKDIGLSEWFFDFDDEADLPRLAPAVLAMAKDPAAAKSKAAKARAFVEEKQKETIAVLRKSLPGA